MPRIALAILLSLSLTQAYAMPVIDRAATADQWSAIIVTKDDSQNTYLLRTAITDDLKGCTQALHDLSPKIMESEGGAVVWTNRDKTTLNFEKTANVSESRVRVLEIKCAPGPYPFND